MSALIMWLESHDNLAGWAQFLGAVLALAVTYFTAFAPVWRRKRQLRNAARRLLSNGYETIKSYHRTSADFTPFALSLRQAALTMSMVAEEINRFPIYELDDQGSRSTARCLVAVSMTLSVLRLFLESVANDLDRREGTECDKAQIRKFVGEHLKRIEDMLSGKEIQRPEWPEIRPTRP